MFDITSDPIDVGALRQDLLAPSAGGAVIFEGLVRDHNEGKAVTALEYEIYADMAQAEAARILAEAREKFDLIALRGAHRSGFLEIGEMAVWVGASARHRAEAFAACRYVIDEVKDRLPVWKKEHYVDGPSAWVDCQGCGHHHHRAIIAEHYYSRQLCLSDFGVPGQQALQEGSVLVVGAGGLGCPALASLAGAGVGRITICDGDRLDVSNLHRQTLYTHDEVGEAKASLAARHLAALNPLPEIAAHECRVDAENVAELVSDHDVVLDCTDNFATRFLLHDTCHAQGKVLVQAGVYQYEGQLQVFDFRGETEAGCLRCEWPEEPATGCVGTCTEVGVLGAVTGVLGNMQALETIKLLTGRETPAAGSTVLVDLLSLEITRIARPRRPDCPLCGAQPAPLEPHHEAWEITLDEFKRRFPGGRVIDIREDWERDQVGGHDAAWEHLPLSQPRPLRELDRRRQTLLICQHGVRTWRVVSALRHEGDDHIWSLPGGVSALPR